MLDLDKIRSIQSLPHLSFEDSKLAIFTRLHKYEDALPLVLAELDRLTTELAAKDAEIAALKAGPVVEWRDNPRPGSVDTWVCHMGCMSLWVVVGFPADHRRRRGSGWWISVSGLGTLDSGPEAGPAGKAACEAAYRRACGLPAIPACAG